MTGTRVGPDWRAGHRVVVVPGLAVDQRQFPYDIGLLGRYGDRLDRLPRARHLWESLPWPVAQDGLATAGLVDAAAP